MKIFNRVIEHADDASRLRRKNSVSRLDSARNNKVSFYEGLPARFAPLLPPFMQNKRQKFSPVERSFSRVSREIADHDVTQHAYLRRTEKITSLERGAALLSHSNFRKGATGESRSWMSSRSEKVASKSDVSCEDTKVTSEAICEALQGLDRHEAECLAEMGEQHDYLESPDSDHREWNGDFQKGETDYQEWRNVEKDEAPWTSARCESLLSFSESDHEDQDPSTTDPLLAHELLVPYNRMPRPRLFHAGKEDTEYIITALPRRPRSPVRHILPGRFDLRASTEELLKRQCIAKTRRYLRMSKDRITRSVKQVSDADVDFDLLICMLVLRAVCEQVILTMAGANTGTDVHTFVNTTIIWALVDLQISDQDALDELERIMCIEFGLFDTNGRPRSREAVETPGTSKLRRALFEVRRPKFDPRIFTHLHRCLPWALVGPAHQRNIVKFYPNARQLIDERLPYPSVNVRLAYVPDLTCFHLREVPDKAYVAYKRKSKSLPVPATIDRKQDDELLVQLVSFV